MNSEKRRIFNPELNLNVIVTSLVLIALSWVGSNVVKGREDIIKLTVQQNQLIDQMKTTISQEKFELKVHDIDSRLQELRVRTLAIETDILGMKKQLNSATK